MIENRGIESGITQSVSVGSGNRGKLEIVPVVEPPAAFGNGMIRAEYFDTVDGGMEQVIAGRGIFMPVWMGPDNRRIGKTIPDAGEVRAFLDRDIRTIDQDITQLGGGYLLAGQDQIIVRNFEL